MKTAIVANTPLQLLSAINIVVNDVEETKANTDLFLIMSFRGSEEIAKRLTDTGIFRKIIQAKKNDNNVTSFWDSLKAKKLLAMYDFSDTFFINDKYDQLFISDRNMLGVALNYLSKAKIFVYDDGIASYKGNCIVSDKVYKYPLINKLFRSDVLSYDIRKLYVNNKLFCKSTISRNIEQLPKLNEENKAVAIAKKVFAYESNSPLLDHCFLILEQPISKKQNYNGLSIREVVEKLDLEGQKPLVRLHPVQKDLVYETIDMDEVNNLWEIECINGLSDEHILLSYFSTVQFSPKLIADKEPYVIFMYPLFLTNGQNNETAGFEEMIRTLKENYRHPEKIYTPKNEAELQEIVKGLKNA